MALIIVYIAFIGVLLRKITTKYWRPIHQLMYVVLLVAIIHANLQGILGSDFQNLGIAVIMNALAVLSMVTFFLKRIQRKKMLKK